MKRNLQVYTGIMLAVMFASSYLVSCKKTDEYKPPEFPVLPEYRDELSKTAERWLNHKQTALLIIDMQNAYMPALNQRQTQAKIQQLIDKAEIEQVPIIWIYMNDSSSPEGSSRFEMVKPLSPDIHYQLHR